MHVINPILVQCFIRLELESKGNHSCYSCVGLSLLDLERVFCCAYIEFLVFIIYFHSNKRLHKILFPLFLLKTNTLNSRSPSLVIEIFCPRLLSTATTTLTPPSWKILLAPSTKGDLEHLRQRTYDSGPGDLIQSHPCLSIPFNEFSCFF